MRASVRAETAVLRHCARAESVVVVEEGVEFALVCAKLNIGSVNDATMIPAAAILVLFIMIRIN